MRGTARAHLATAARRAAPASPEPRPITPRFLASVQRFSHCILCGSGNFSLGACHKPSHILPFDPLPLGFRFPSARKCQASGIAFSLLLVGRGLGGKDLRLLRTSLSLARFDTLGAAHVP